MTFVKAGVMYKTLNTSKYRLIINKFIEINSYIPLEKELKFLNSVKEESLPIYMYVLHEVHI